MGRFVGSIVVAVALLAGAAGYWAGSAHLLAPHRAAADDECATFAETGKTVCGRFLQYWREHGGLAQQGFPLSDAFTETSAVDSRAYLVQYFERAVFEYHPDNAPPYDVLLSLLGRERYLAKYPSGPGGGTAAPPPSTPFPRSANGLGFTLTVNTVRDPGPTDKSNTPKPGNRYVAVDITLQNTGNATIPINRTYARLKMTDDREYGREGNIPDPQLLTGTLQPGQATRGWVNFEVPAGAVLLSFTYDPTAIKGPATVPLR